MMLLAAVYRIFCLSLLVVLALSRNHEDCEDFYGDHHNLSFLVLFWDQKF